MLALDQIKHENFNKLHFVLGFVKEKDLDRIIELFPKNAEYYFCKPNIERGLEVNVLKTKFNEKGYLGSAFDSVDGALDAAKKEQIIRT